MQPIPLIRAATVAELADVVDAQGAPADRLLAYARISSSVREDPLGFVPGRCVWTFAGEITRREVPRDFLFQMARLSDWRRARWAPPLAHTVILGDALRRMCSSYAREIPMVRMGLTVSGSLAWFWRIHLADVSGWDGNEAAEQYTLSYMMEVIRAAAGSAWRPACLSLLSSRWGWAAACPALSGVRKLWDQPQLAVALPLPLLALPIAIQLPSQPVPAGEPAGQDFQSSLRQVLRASLVGGLPNQDVFARTLGMGGRTLRRRLAQEGTSWRSVVNDVRFERASDRLLRGRASVGGVAQELGFSDTPHFTRFFRSRTGVPPGRWREHVEQAQELAGSP